MVPVVFFSFTASFSICSVSLSCLIFACRCSVSEKPFHRLLYGLFLRCKAQRSAFRLQSCDIIGMRFVAEGVRVLRIWRAPFTISSGAESCILFAFASLKVGCSFFVSAACSARVLNRAEINGCTAATTLSLLSTCRRSHSGQSTIICAILSLIN